MQHGADVRLLVQRAHEVQHARVLADGAGVLAVGLLARAARAQRGVPGGLVLGPVHRLAREQRLHRPRHAAGAQQGQPRRLQRGRLTLHGQVQAQARRLDQLERAGVQFRATRRMVEGAPFGAVRQSRGLRLFPRKFSPIHRVVLLRTVNGHEARRDARRCGSPPRCAPGRPSCPLRNAARPSAWCWTAAPGRSRRHNPPARRPDR